MFTFPACEFGSLALTVKQALRSRTPVISIGQTNSTTKWFPMHIPCLAHPIRYPWSGFTKPLILSSNSLYILTKLGGGGTPTRTLKHSPIQKQLYLYKFKMSISSNYIIDHASCSRSIPESSWPLAKQVGLPLEN